MAAGRAYQAGLERREGGVTSSKACMPPFFRGRPPHDRPAQARLAALAPAPARRRPGAVPAQPARGRGGPGEWRSPAMTWQCWLDGKPFGLARRTRQAAQNLVDRPYLKGPAWVQASGTGTILERRGGGWYPPDTKAVLPKAGVP